MSRDYRSILKNVLLATGVWTALMVVICCVTAGLIGAEIVPAEMGRLVAVLLTELALFVVCLVTVKAVARNRLPVALVIATAAVAIRCLFKVILFREMEFQTGWMVIVPFMAAAAAGCMASMKKQRRR